MDKDSKIKGRKIALYVIAVVLLISWCFFAIGDPGEMKAIRQATVMSLEEEGIAEQNIQSLKVLYYCGVLGLEPRDSRYSVSVLIKGEDQYRTYLWKSGSSEDKSQGIAWEHTAYQK